MCACLRRWPHVHGAGHGGADRIARTGTRCYRGPHALDSRREAIGDNTVALRAVVGEASMSVNELTELALDDVLVLDQRLSDLVTLVSPASGIAVTTGNLGRSGARRAIKIAASPAHRN